MERIVSRLCRILKSVTFDLDDLLKLFSPILMWTVQSKIKSLKILVLGAWKDVFSQAVAIRYPTGVSECLQSYKEKAKVDFRIPPSKVASEETALVAEEGRGKRKRLADGTPQNQIKRPKLNADQHGASDVSHESWESFVLKFAGDASSRLGSITSSQDLRSSLITLGILIGQIGQKVRLLDNTQGAV